MTHYRILSIDGGGFRGVYAAHILARIEKQYKIKSNEYFHMLAGTSTGSIIAAGLACGISAEELLNFYEIHGEKIFPRHLIPSFGLFKSTYKNDYLRSILKDVVGDRTLGEINIPLILPATDIGNGCVHVFKSAYDKSFVRDKDVLLRDAILASCSAPIYFDPVQVNEYFLADGGLWANSPSLVAIIDAKRRLGKDLDTLKVLSVGTGVSRSFYLQKQSWWHRIVGWGFATRWWHKKFISMLLNLQSETANNMAGLLLRPEQILRLNFDSDSSLSLDDVKDLKDLKSRADKEFTRKADKIKDFLELGKGEM